MFQGLNEVMATLRRCVKVKNAVRPPAVEKFAFTIRCLGF
jgi:hypothetical protein